MSDLSLEIEKYPGGQAAAGLCNCFVLTDRSSLWNYASYCVDQQVLATAKPSILFAWGVLLGKLNQLSQNTTCMIILPIPVFWIVWNSPNESSHVHHYTV